MKRQPFKDQAIRLHIDGNAGAAGDMFIGALIGVGVPESVFKDAFEAVGISSSRFRVERCLRKGIAGVDVKIDDGGDSPFGPHPTYSHLQKVFDGSSLSIETKKCALRILETLAKAEAHVHGCELDKVHFHEVGAIDSVADIVGAAAGMTWLSPGEVTCFEIAVGRGSAHTEHGVIPVPAPATLQIFAELGVPIVAGDLAMESCTPTGAAILATCVTHWGKGPRGRVLGAGYGAGDKELACRPNMLRLSVYCDIQSQQPWDDETIHCIKANIDDMNPEYCQEATQAIMKAGAVDVTWTQATMKKGRPSFVLEALVPEASKEKTLETIFSYTSTFGVRYHEEKRAVLRREWITAETENGPVRVKLGWLGDLIIRRSPEFSSCQELAEQKGIPAISVYEAAQRAIYASLEKKVSKQAE